MSASVCSFFTACYHAADFGRADTWAELLRRHGLIGPAAGSAVFLSSHCDAVHATLLVELGRWGEAEELLQRSIEEFRAVMPMPAWHPTIALADLRVRQGRLIDAEQLLLGWDQFMQALLPTARLHLARGDHDLARAVARRGVQVAGSDRLRAAELLTVLVDAELGRGDVAAASAACAELATRIGDVDVPPLRARSDCARSRALVAAGDAPAAVAVLNDVLGALDPAQLPLVRAGVLLALARAHDAAGDDMAARQAARARPMSCSVASTSSLLPTTPSSSPASGGRPTPRHPPRTRCWPMTAGGGRRRATPRACGCPTARACATWPSCSARPPSNATRWTSSIASRASIRRSTGAVSAMPARPPTAPPGPPIDGASRRSARRSPTPRPTAAMRSPRPGTSSSRPSSAQLAQAFGLGGRDRPQASAAERARLNVTRALRSAITRLAEALPAAGAALDRGVQTGRYCVYRPLDGDVRWIVQSPVNGSIRRMNAKEACTR